VIARLALVLSFMGCISQAKQAIAPEPDGSGTLSCREIVEQCDSQCADPFCLSRCSNQGTPDGGAQHQALLECGQRNGCIDEDCMRASCPAEIQTCLGDAPDAAPEDAAPADAAPADAAPPPAPSDG
jgi:hypothetical protein